MRIEEILLFTILGILIGATTQFYLDLQVMKCETCDMLQDHFDQNIGFGVNGFYNAGEYYCVWDFSDATLKESIAQHEICHKLVYYNKDHYCKGDKLK